MKLLFVDDLAVNRALLAAMLERFLPGIEVLEAETGQQALQLLEREDVSAAFIDLRLPDMDGLQVVTKARKALRAANRPDVPMLLVTADYAPEISLWGVVVLHKPLDLGTLTSALVSTGIMDSYRPVACGVNCLADGVPDMLRHLLPELSATLLELHARGVRGVTAGAWDEVAATVHDMKGVAANFGLHQFVSVARALEDAIAQHDSQKVKALLGWVLMASQTLLVDNRIVN